MRMRSDTRKLLLLCSTCLILVGHNIAIAQAPLPGAQPINVVGTWMIEAKNWNGEFDTKSIDLQHNGNIITGHFKGPRQSGSLEGSINAHHILFRTKTRTPLTFRGQVQGDTIQGTFNVRGRKGEWHAWRSSPN